jgi:hypothetical protein
VKLILAREGSARLATPDSIGGIKALRLLGFERERERVHASATTRWTSSCCSSYFHPLDGELLLVAATSILCILTRTATYLHPLSQLIDGKVFHPLIDGKLVHPLQWQARCAHL